MYTGSQIRLLKYAWVKSLFCKDPIGASSWQGGAAGEPGAAPSAGRAVSPLGELSPGGATERILSSSDLHLLELQLSDSVFPPSKGRAAELKWEVRCGTLLPRFSYIFRISLRMLKPLGFHLSDAFFQGCKEKLTCKSGFKGDFFGRFFASSEWMLSI